ncbi:MAG: dihydrodipicolinate synthase family protein [Burkholderiaceae bacterium]
MNQLTLVNWRGQLEPYRLQGQALEVKPVLAFNRIAYSAAHVVADARAANDPWKKSRLDWEATLAYRHHLWSLGLGVAEAMDTAQRGMGLDWATSRELIQRSLQAARTVPGARIASGCGTDHLDLPTVNSLDDVIRAYDEQIEAIECMGGQLIIMASRALVKVARSAADYEKVYDHILSQVRQPVILHWLGDMFDPSLAGYWGNSDLDAASATALGVIQSHANKVDGIKISLLDKNREISLRRQLPPGVRMYTGDDFNYAELIAGDGQGAEEVHRHSDALLGIFDAIAPAASAALGELAQGHVAQFHRILAPTLPLSRLIFQAPTQFYKTGVVFMAWLNGHQSHFVMVGGQQSARSLPHLCDIFRLADQANLLYEPDLAMFRMRHLLAVHGVD